MSGGAIFNTNGEVIGINGKSAFPIVNTGYNNEDGTKPSTDEIEQLRRLSWGLSINRLLARVNPEIITAYNLPLPETTEEVKTPLTGWLGELEAKAKQITVRIDSSSGANGSGVIIAKEGNIYSVLTADHVICESESQSRDCIDYSYSILAPDGQKYPVNIDTVKRQPGVDLAVVKFTSNEEYQVAELANYPLTTQDAVFVAGYPQLSKNTLAQWLFSLGYGLEPEQGLFQVGDSSLKSDSSDLPGSQAGSLAGGYSMVYTSITYGGMSGGAVLDTNGRVIGIHGLTEGQTALNNQSGLATQVQLGYSLGIPLNTFVGLADRLGMAGLPVQENRPKPLDTKEAESFVAVTLGAEISEGNTKPEKWLERGNQLWRLLRLEEAVEAFDRVIALNPEFVHLAHYGKGVALAEDEKFEAALASLDSATEIQPDFAPAFLRKSALLDSLERGEEALVAIETAISLQPNNANYYSEKGNILSKLKRYEAAEVAYERAIDLNPRSSFYFSRGNLYSDQGKLDLALADYNQALAIKPNFADVYVNRGGVYHKQGKLDLALADYNQALAIKPNSAQAYTNRGLVYHKQGKLNLALANHNQALAINPNFAGAYYNRGLVYYKQGKLEPALSDYERAIAINPNLAGAYNQRGLVYLEHEKLDLALSDYERAIAINPNLAEAYINRGVLYVNQGKEKLALSDFNQAIAINPNNAQAYYSLGFTNVKLGDIKKAKFNFEKAQQLYIAQGDTQGEEQTEDRLQRLSKPEQSGSVQASKPNPNSAEDYYDRGLEHYKQGKLELALSDYDRALAINPNLAEAYNSRGALYQDKEKLELALSDYDRAIEINPNLAEAYNNRGLIYKDQGKPELALSDYERAIAINPTLAEVYFNRGLVYSDRGKLDLALSDYNQAVAFEPNHAEAYTNRGLIYSNQGKLELALSDYERAIAINPNLAEAYVNRGILYENQGKPESALSDYNRAIAINPYYANAYFNRGLVYLQQGKLDLALSDFNQAIAINPNDVRAYYGLGLTNVELGDIKKAKFNFEKALQLFIAQGNTQGEEQTKALLQQLSKLEQSE